jgi:hypothetical protein
MGKMTLTSLAEYKPMARPTALWMLEAWIPTLKRAAPLRTSIETLTT